MYMYIVNFFRLSLNIKKQISVSPLLLIVYYYYIILINIIIMHGKLILQYFFDINRV